MSNNWINPLFPTDLFNTFLAFDNDYSRRSTKKANVFSTPAANTYFKDNQYTIELLSPGLSRDDFDIRVENNCFVVQVETTDGEEETRTLNQKEWSYTSFKRMWQLPKNANVEAIEARYEAGILYVTIPSLEKNEKVISIEVN